MLFFLMLMCATHFTGRSRTHFEATRLIPQHNHAGQVVKVADIARNKRARVPSSRGGDPQIVVDYDVSSSLKHGMMNISYFATLFHRFHDGLK